MSSVRSAPSISLKLVPSRRLIIGAALSHLLAAVSLVFVDLPLWSRITLGLLIAASFAFNVIRYGNPQSPWFVEQVTCSAGGQWRLRRAGGLQQEVRLQGHYWHPQLIILNFALGRFRRRSVVVLPDSSDSEEIRRLRVQLQTMREGDPGL